MLRCPDNVELGFVMADAAAATAAAIRAENSGMPPPCDIVVPVVFFVAVVAIGVPSVLPVGVPSVALEDPWCS